MHLIHQLTKSLESAAIEADRAPMIKYMKGHFDFYGVRSPQRKEIFRNVLKANGLPKENQFIPTILDLMNHPKREMNYCAIDLAIRGQKKYSKPEDIDWIREMITTRSWWDTVDGIAPNILGRFFLNYPNLRNSYIEDFLASNNLWLQRSTLLFQLKYKDKTDQELLFSLCQQLAASKEFFIQKAIGWSLRQHAYVARDAVYEFVEKHPLSKLSTREALKHKKD